MGVKEIHDYSRTREKGRFNPLTAGGNKKVTHT